MPSRIIIVLVFSLMLSSFVSAELLLYSDDDKFHGCLDCTRFDTDSICNNFGTYGRRFNSDSIWNRFGIGSRFDSDSPWSRFGTGLKIVDRSGNFYGYFSISLNGSTSYSKLARALHEILDDLSEIRDAGFFRLRQRCAIARR